MADGVSLTVDASQFEAFARLGPREMDRVARTWLQRGSLIVQRLQRLEAKKRFGRETAESGMQSVDPRRPKGVWSGSVQVKVGVGEASIRPNVPYAWWVERGREAPRGVPRSHRNSRFVGHKPVERAKEAAERPLLELAERLVAGGLGRATSAAGGQA